MKLTPTFETRSFAAVGQPEGVFTVNSMRWGAVGGCKEASISVTGGKLEIWEMMDYLRCPVVIRDDKGRACWWGYVHEAQVREGELEVAVSVAEMCNRVAAVYSFVEAGTNKVGQRKTTAWVEDADSIAAFGYKERLESLDGCSTAEAEARRDMLKLQMRYPQAGVGAFGSPRGRVRDSGAKRSMSATLVCRGWWETLGWRYASVDSLAAIGYTANSTEQRVGYAAADERLMQQVTVGVSSIHALQVKLYVRKAAAPVDNFTVGLYAVDGSGNPTGSALATATLAGGGITTSLVWYTFTLSAEVELSANTMYAIQVSRSGANDSTNYYLVGVNVACGYTGGAFKIYNSGGPTWGARATDADMNFVVLIDDEVDTVSQMRDLITVNGQFVSAVTVDALSGVLRQSYQDGTLKALAVVEELMKAGGVNDRRIISKVDVNRRAWLWEEPSPTDVDYHLSRYGELTTPGGLEVATHLPPVGVWIRMVDLLPKTVDTTRLITPEVQFAEGAVWDKDEGLRFEWRGMPSVEDLWKLRI